MTTWHDVDELERQKDQLADELKDAKRVLEMYVIEHSKYTAGIKCGCDTCKQAVAWLARNKQA